MQERKIKGSAAGKKSGIAFLKGRYKRSLDNGRGQNRPMKHQQNFGAPLKSSLAPLSDLSGVCTAHPAPPATPPLRKTIQSSLLSEDFCEVLIRMESSVSQQ